jgi:hypothetical protein
MPKTPEYPSLVGCFGETDERLNTRGSRRSDAALREKVIFEMEEGTERTLDELDMADPTVREVLESWEELSQDDGEGDLGHILQDAAA